MAIQEGIELSNFAAPLSIQKYGAQEGMPTLDQLNRIEDCLTESIPINFVSHAEFKKEAENAKVIIRNGKNTSYSNIILRTILIF